MTIKKVYNIQEYFTDTYYVEEMYERNNQLRRRFWFTVNDEGSLRYEGGMSYLNGKRRAVTYKNPPKSIQELLKDEGFTLLRNS